MINLSKLNIIKLELENLMIKHSTDEWEMRSENYKLVDKLFTKLRLKIPDVLNKSWGSGGYYSLEDIKKLNEFNEVLIKDVSKIELSQGVLTDSALDEIIDRSRSEQLGTLESIYGHLSDRDYELYRTIMRSAGELIKQSDGKS